ncbi:OmpA family protein [Vibrio sp. MMG022]|uniref:OmpA family protein n=1 Tax=Vibrio sp. MMG023 TaxID=2909979 RepID=UPI001F17946A|nr:OmpA family protein [Vibrio sp. MMG023]MCF6452575.1 OmpA family protein [Vibrio sp. MMG023]
MNKVLLASVAMMLASPSYGIEGLEERHQSYSSFKSHFYLGGRLGWAGFQDSCGSEADTCNDDTLGGGVYTGYQINNWFGLELGLTDYGDPYATYDTYKVNADISGVELASKLSYQLSSKWSVFSRLGASYQVINKASNLHPERNDDDWNTLISLGASYHFSKHWSLRAEYQFIDGIGGGDVLQSDLHFSSLGITYQFGQKSAPPVLKPKENNVAEPIKQLILPPVIVTEELSLGAEALFASNSTSLESNAELEKLLEALNRYEQGQVKIIGHSDSTGASAYNQNLSEQRAQEVANYLVFNGVERERITVIGAGETLPIADNNTEEGRAQNRRVEIRFETTVTNEINKDVGA